MTKFDDGDLVVDGGDSLTLDEDSLASSIFVGSNSTGTLRVEAGAELNLTKNDGVFLIGANAGGDGLVTITGVSSADRSTIDISRTGNPGATPFLEVGGLGTGVLNIENHALLRTQTASIGLEAGSSGTLNLRRCGMDRF